MERKKELVEKKMALKAVRRAIGYAAQGMLPSQSVLKKVQDQLDQALAAEALPLARKLLQSMLAVPMLPNENAARAAFDETQAALKRCA